jgi:glycine/D-amino acid oxidase-like deaminating enzyme
MAYLETRCQQMQALGATVELVDAARAEAISASPVYCHGGILDPSAGTIHPLNYVHGLAKAALEQGAQLFQESGIETLSRQNDRWLASTSRGEVSADQVIIATNAYADKNSEKVNASTLPVFIFQCATEPLPADVAASIIPQRHGLWDTQTLMTSSRIDSSGRLVMSGAGRLQGLQRAIRENWMTRSRDRLFPQAAGSAWEYQWSGQIGVTASKILRVQILAPGVFAPSGYNGRGIGPGTVIGKHLADTIVSGNRDDFPFPIEALYHEKWSGARAAYYNYGTLALQFIDRR